MKVSQLIMALGISGASVAGFGGIADASPVAPAAAAACVSDDVVPDAGNASTISDASIGCDVPACVEGALSVVTDDNGVQHLACVASAAEAALPAKTATIAAASPVSGNDVATSASAELPRTGKGSDGLLIAALLVASGSVASLLARRKR